jgi:hypothetical protein
VFKWLGTLFNVAKKLDLCMRCFTAFACNNLSTWDGNLTRDFFAAFNFNCSSCGDSIDPGRLEKLWCNSRLRLTFLAHAASQLEPEGAAHPIKPVGTNHKGTVHCGPCNLGRVRMALGIPEEGVPCGDCFAHYPDDRIWQSYHFDSESSESEDLDETLAPLFL